MKSEDWLGVLRQERAIAVIRAPDIPTGVEMARAVAAGGLHLLEVTWSSAQPIELIKVLKSELPDCIVGAGTVTRMSQLQQAVAGGAEFLFAPGINDAIVQAAVQAEIPMVPGALTPTEILHAAEIGAASVKVFPIQAVGNARYVKSLQVPLAGIPLIPTGGVTIDNAASMVAAGAIAVGLAGDLFPRAAMQAEQWEVVRSRARQLVESLADYRQIN